MLPFGGFPPAHYLQGEVLINPPPSLTRNLVFGPKEDDPQNVVSGGLLEAIAGTGFEGLANARRLGDWIERGENGGNASFLLELEPPWLGRIPSPIQLELTRTSVEVFWIITSVPHGQIPTYVPPPKQEEDAILTTLKEPPPALNIQPLPPLSEWTGAPADPSTIAQTRSPYELTSTGKEPQPMPGSKMADHFKNYPWENHPLGPMELWPQSLKSAVSAALAAPYPWAVWWGPELNLIYNDAYAKSVAFEDDLLLFGRLTDKLLPEETYHNWAYIPITAEDGSVGGFFNTTFESTSKILYERRIQILRALGDRTTLARSRLEFATAMKHVLTEDAHKDIPFVAFYFNVVDIPLKSGRDTEYKHPHKGRIRVTSTLAFKIGVPEGHPAIPDRVVHFLDPTNLRLMLPSTERRRGASPGSTIDARSLPDDSTVVTTSPDEPDPVMEREKEPTPMDDASWPFFDVFRAKRPLHVTALPSTIGQGFGFRKNGWNDVLREAIVMPIAAEGDEVPIAVVVLGVNTRRPYDKEYQTWIDLLHMTLNSTLTATLSREAELKKAEQLAQLDAAKTSFFSSASHELRTPLTLIAGPVQEALRITTDAKVKRQLAMTARNIDRLQKLVDSLMDFTRVEGDRLYGRFIATSLVDFTTDLAELFRNPIEKNKIEFIVTSDRTNEATAYVDHDLWEKIVFNLIGNAFKYTLAGQVHIHFKYRPGWAEFSVSDTGCGIADNEKERVFERFHRSSATARTHEGTGIGLALTRELVKLHGGYITLQSTPEDKDNPEASHGSTFTVHIPVGCGHLPPANVEEEATATRARPRAYGRAMIEEVKGWNNNRSTGDDKDRSESGGSESNANSNSESVRSGEFSSVFRFSPEDTILLVDDNPDVRGFLRSIFQSYCNVIEAQNGNAGLVAIEEKLPDLVISDVMMPGMDGIQLVSTIRENQRISWTPVILLTAKSAEDDRIEGLTSGADDFISKPFKTQELIARAHLHLNLGKRKRDLMNLFEERTKEIKILSDLSPVGIFRTDSQGEMTYTNRRWHEITDFPSSQPLTNWLLNVHFEFQRDVLDLTIRVLRTGEGESMEIRWQNERWTKLQVEKIAHGLIGTVTDLSDRHLYEAARIAQAQEREALAQLRAADAERQRAEADERRRAQELLVDVTSHELRQPVSAILNCSQLVRTNLDKLAASLRKSRDVPFIPTDSLLKQIEEDLEALDSIYQCGLSQERIANDVLSLSRLQLDTLSIHITDFQLVPELQQIISIFANELKMKKITLEIKVGGSVTALNVSRVSSDRTRFAQILTNLMSNAIKFTDIAPIPNRQIAVSVEVSLDPPQANKCIAPPLPARVDDLQEKVKNPGTLIYIYVAVRDSGPGLKPGDLALLFQRFQQGSNSHDVFGGSGLGLFVSRKLCELMGGNIDVDSVYGQGATFRFYLRMKTAAEPGPKVAPPSPPTVVRATPLVVAPSSQTAYHILITEDNIINQTVLNRQLKQAGFTTELASNGKEAIEKVKHLAFSTDTVDSSLPRRFDVILMDCEMPVMDGHTATREIRRMESEGVLPLRNRIIALTGNARQGQIEAALQAGMDDVMYPYPAFVLNKRVSGKHAASLLPIFTNAAFRNLVFGPRENEPQNIIGGGLLEALAGTGFEGLANARRLGDWLEESPTPTNARFLVDLEPPWLGRTASQVQLELIKTSIDAFWIITSVPRGELPKYVPPAKQTEDILLTTLKDPPSPVLPAKPLHALPEWAEAPLDPMAIATTKSPYDLKPRDKEPTLQWLTAGTDMVDFTKNYNWENHPLGPPDKWPQSLKSSMSAVMASPYPWSLWWGPDLVLLYNDAYAIMSGAKHPALFAQYGKIGKYVVFICERLWLTLLTAWGELWESIGPLADQVIRERKSIAREDDLLFFGRLTDKMLPEETYHNWAWIPVIVEDGSVGGFFNTTFESTSKILYERRIQILRSLGDRTALARSRTEFAEAMRAVLNDDAHKDVPFAAFYFNTVDASPKAGREGENSRAQKARIRVTSTLAFQIGVPDGHPAIPEREVHLLDPITLRPSPALLTKRSGASPGSTIDARSLPDDTTVVAHTPGDSDAALETLRDALQADDTTWPFFDVFSAKRPLHITSLPASIGKGFGLRKNGWNDVLREAIVMPIAAEGDEVPIAVMIFGVNTRRPYDKEYQTWIELLNMTLSSTLTATLGREAELKKAEQLAQLDAAKTSFFSSASHELRTPLTLIAGPVQEALRLTSEPRVKQQLTMTTRNIERLQKLVDSLMDFTRVEGGRMYGRFRATSLAEYTTDLAELFRNPIEKNNIEYLVTSNHTNEATAFVDHDLWEKIVPSLLDTLSGQVRVHISYRPGWAEFSVSDTGCGISPNELDKVFERFHRGSATARSHEGTGIGLALTRELVKLHGGHITLDSKPEDKDDPSAPHGSTFTVHIPLGYEHLPPANVEEELAGIRAAPRAYGRAMLEEAKGWNRIRAQSDDKDRSESGGSESNANSNTDSSRSGELSGLFRFSPDDTILIVDDSKFLRSIFQSYCNVLEAESAIKGLGMIEEKAPDLVLSDVMMPGMDGIQFVGAIRDRQSISWTPIILLTARSGEEARVEGLTSGADDYISKPFKTQELIARVHLHLNLGKRKRELLNLFEERTKEIKIVSDLSPVGIFRTDNQGEMTYTNRRWHEITDYPSNQPLTNWLWNVHPEFQKNVLELTTRVLRTGEGGSLEIRWQNERWTKLQVESISNGLIGTVTDVSDRHLYEAARIAQAQEREAIAQLRAADAERQRAEADERRRAQELLVDVTSHELRQPVSAILNCSQLVRTNLSNLAEALRKSRVATPFVPTDSLLKQIEDDLDALDSIYQCGLSQERIANDVLSLSRLQLDTLSIHAVDFQLVPELQRIISIFANELKMKKINLDMIIGQSVVVLNVDRVSSDHTDQPDVQWRVHSKEDDEIRLTAFAAIKFTDIAPMTDRRIVVCLDVSLDPPQANKCIAPPLPQNTDEVKAKIKIPGTLVYVYVAVQDSGPGLKPGDLALLFQRFQQGSNSHEVFGGSGLGLFVSRKLCELMGGNIGVDSVYGQGATFRFYLQMKTAAEPEPKPASPVSPPKARPAIAAPPAPSQTAYHILITEDNIINQTVLNRQLKQAGFTTELASNGKEAIEKIKRLAFGTDNIDPSLPRRFDVILMDCEMPVMDGHTATREIRRLESEGVLPLRNRIIALTGNARQGQVEASLQAGMDDVMIKPYKIDELVLKIRDKTMLD
ncbi:hypothetical protein FRC05_008486 [Tulasnella sp. 425]|nr:hypothetical protein FRC05_008486 [Tulasnella sp. 425]